MKIKWSGLCFAFLCLNFSLAFAVSPAPFEILTPVISGSGCEKESAIGLPRQADGTVKLQFNNSIASTGIDFSSFSRKNCSLVIPVQVNSGYNIALPTLELNGSVELKRQAKASLGVEIFFVGKSGVISKKDLFPDKKFNFTPKIDQSQWSPCGKAVNVRMNINFLVNSSFEKTNSHLKLIDGMARFARWKRCKL